MSKKIMRCIIKEECDIIYEEGTDIEQILLNPIKKDTIHRTIEINTIYDYDKESI